MPAETPNPRHVWSITVTIEASAEDADNAAEAIARALCPDKDHDGPCPVPWTLDSSEVDGQHRLDALEEFDTQRP